MFRSYSLLVLILFALVSCKGSDSTGGFAGLDAIDPPPPVTTDPDSVSVVEIIEFTPVSTPVILLSSGTQVFGVVVNAGSGDVNFKFFLDNVLVKNGTSPFYELSSLVINSGPHILKVVATNSLGSAEKSFNIIRNSPPIVSLASSTPTTIACGLDSFQLNVSGFDANGDPLTFSFLLNGSTHPNLVGTSTPSTAEAVFTPPCTLNGTNSVTIRATDINGEYGEYSASVLVTNPNIATIDAYSPLDPIVTLASNQNGIFTVSASGNPPLGYTWTITPGGVIGSCTGATCTITAGSFTPGVYNLNISVVDALASSDDHDFSIVINGAPSIQTALPGTGETFKMDCSTAKNFQVSFTDGNFPSSPAQTYTVTWLLNGNPSGSIGSVLNSSVSPMVSTATFSPNCNPSLLGDQEIRAVVSDGIEQVQASWTVRTNYFSDTCNNLLPGRVCTLAGTTGMPIYQLPADEQKVRIFPRSVRADGNHGYFIVDERYRSIWYYNTSGSPRTILGISVASNQMRIVAGNGGDGAGIAGQNSLDFAFRDPYDIAYSSTGELYVADYVRRQIIKFNSSGTASIFAGGGANSPQGGSRTAHILVNTTAIELDEANDRLFATSYWNSVNGGLKAFSLTNDEGWLIANGGGDNAIEGALDGTALIPRGAYGLAKDPNNAVLFATDLFRCQILALNYGATPVSYYGGDLSVPAGQLRKLTLNEGNCADTSTNKTWDDITARLRTYYISAYSVGGETRGIFITESARHHVMLLNLTDTDITLGGQLVTAKSHNRIYGVYNNATYGRGTPAHISSYLSSPQKLNFSPDFQRLLISDRNNFRVAVLSTSAPNGASFDLVGFKEGFDDDSNKHAQERLFYDPRGLAFDDLHNKLWILDDLNGRIRSVDLITGVVKTEIGIGLRGASITNPEQPQASTMRFITLSDISVDANTGEVVYTDRNGGGNNENQNCIIRSYNPLSDTDVFWGKTIPGNRVVTVVGSYARGCGVWQPTSPNNAPVDGDIATSFRIDDPYGIAPMKDRSKMYFSMRNRHYIMSVDDSGELRHEIGTYNIAGSLDGALGVATLNAPGDLELDSDEDAADCGNFFIVDLSQTTNSRIRYANYCTTSMNIAGVPIPASSVTTIHSTTTHSYIAAVTSFDNQICYTRGRGGTVHDRAHGVLCFDRNSGATTLTVGIPEGLPASVVKGGVPISGANEGVKSTSARLYMPYGLAFDRDGNLYFVDFESIKMVRRWW